MYVLEGYLHTFFAFFPAEIPSFELILSAPRVTIATQQESPCPPINSSTHIVANNSVEIFTTSEEGRDESVLRGLRGVCLCTRRCLFGLTRG